MNLLILGANSDVAYAVAKKFAQSDQARIYLASRDLELLHKKATDLNVRYSVEAQAMAFDAEAYDTHGAFYEKLDPKPDVVVLAFGYMDDQKAVQKDFARAQKIIAANFTGAASILELVAADFEGRRQGTIIGISSVAGERGRQSNYFYGASKAALTAYLSGLRNRLAKSNVHVLTVLPGFIDTKMNKDIETLALLTASADEAAEDIYRAYAAKKSIIYTKWFWRWIMAIIKAIPESIFRKLSL